jgi:hypothetical protein
MNISSLPKAKQDHCKEFFNDICTTTLLEEMLKLNTSRESVRCFCCFLNCFIMHLCTPKNKNLYSFQMQHKTLCDNIIDFYSKSITSLSSNLEEIKHSDQRHELCVYLYSEFTIRMSQIVNSPHFMNNEIKALFKKTESEVNKQ